MEAGRDLCAVRMQLFIMKSCLRCFNIQAAAVQRLCAFVGALLYGVQQKIDGNMGAGTSYKHVVPLLLSTNVLTHLFGSPLLMSSLMFD